MSRRRRPRDDAGISMLITLAFVLFVGLVSTAVVGYSGTSVQSGAKTKDRANITYDAGNALQFAINQVRNSTFGNDPNVNGGQCDLAPSDANSRALSFPGPNLSRATAVTCDGGPGTGIAGGLVPVTSANKPGAALLTLGTNPAEKGLDLQGNNTLRIKGRVYLNAGSVVGPGSVQVTNAQFTAKLPCTGSGTITSTPAPNCNATTDSDPIGADPGVTYPASYAQPTTGLTYRPIPACPGGSAKLVTFLPGYYDDAVGLTDFFKNCKVPTYWFRPPVGGGIGLYYFDFHNGEGPALPAGTHIWSISDKDTRVVAGSAQGWDPANPPATGPAIPGACISPLNSTTSQGVEFVFGGDSQLEITAGAMEICGQWDAAKPPVAVYGAKTGPDTLYGPEDGQTDGTGTPTAGDVVFSTPANITTVNQITALAAIPGNKTGSVTVKGFTPASPIPAGSVLTAAVLSVVHQDNVQSGNKPSTIALTITPNPGAGGTVLTGHAQPVGYADPAAFNPSAAAFHTDAIDLKTALAPQVHSNGLAGLQIKYSFSTGAGTAVNENLDSIRITLTWKPPALRGQSGCVVVVNSCNMITTSGPTTYIYFQGTTYTPLARLSVTLNNVSGQVFRSGLVARALQMQLTGSFSSTAPVIELPDNSFGPSPTDVYFKAYTCPDGAVCPQLGNGVPAAPWRLAATARASFEDVNAQVPVAGDRRVAIKSWTILR